MAEIIARFADGRLLVQEARVCEERYDRTIGVPVRIAHIRLVENILSVDSEISGYAEKLVTRLKDVKISGDTIYVKMLRNDLGVVTLTGIASGIQTASGIISGVVTLDGPIGSGASALSVLSGLTSGLAYPGGELLSGNINVSGVVTVLANVIGY